MFISNNRKEMWNQSNNIKNWIKKYVTIHENILKKCFPWKMNSKNSNLMNRKKRFISFDWRWNKSRSSMKTMLCRSALWLRVLCKILNTFRHALQLSCRTRRRRCIRFSSSTTVFGEIQFSWEYPLSATAFSPVWSDWFRRCLEFFKPFHVPQEKEPWTHTIWPLWWETAISSLNPVPLNLC